MQRLEETISRLSEAMFSNIKSSNQHTSGHEPSRTHREEFDGSCQIFSSKMARLEFPKYSCDDPTEWFNRVAQFFKFQSTTENQKVSLDSFHLEGEANQWWQWLQRAY